MKSQIDHVVVVARSLGEGVAWCESTLGVTPGPGGEHKLFGTHNRLLKIATPAFPMAYLEIIAINSEANYSIDTLAKRWFDMDNPVLQAALAGGPRLVHFVAQTPDIAAASAALGALGIDRGPVLQASRHSRKGLLQWQITVRQDGQRLMDGMLPTLIEWGKTGDAEPMRLHPRNSLPRSGVTLHSLSAAQPDTAPLRAAYAAIGLTGVAVNPGPANLTAALHTPKGVVQLHSKGI